MTKVGPVGFEPTTSGPDSRRGRQRPRVTVQRWTLVSSGRGFSPLDQARRIGMSLFRHSAPWLLGLVVGTA